MANRYGYDPYGKLTSSSGSVANPWGYAGGYLDSTGLVKFGARYYDPNLGRWTQRDGVGGSITAPGAIGAYLYVGCNPVNSVDPSGRFCVDVAAFAGLNAGAAILNQWGSWISDWIPDIALDWRGLSPDPYLPLRAYPNPLAAFYAERAAAYKSQAISSWEFARRC